MATVAIVGAEALLRWDDPEIGVVSAGEFVPIAEDSGVIMRIDHLVLDHAIRQLARWRAQGWPHALRRECLVADVLQPRFRGLGDRLPHAPVR